MKPIHTLAFTLMLFTAFWLSTVNAVTAQPVEAQPDPGSPSGYFKCEPVQCEIPYVLSEQEFRKIRKKLAEERRKQKKDRSWLIGDEKEIQKKGQRKAGTYFTSADCEPDTEIRNAPSPAPSRPPVPNPTRLESSASRFIVRRERAMPILVQDSRYRGKVIPVKAFSKLTVNGNSNFIVEIAEGATPTVQGRFREPFIKEINGELQVTVYADELRIVTNRLESVRNCTNGELRIYGLHAPFFQATIDSNGSILAEGEVDDAIIDVMSNGDAQLKGLAIRKRADVLVRGNGSAYVNTSGTLRAQVDSIGQIIYSGKPKSIEKNLFRPDALIADPHP